MNTKKIYSILALFWLLILSQQVMPMPKTALVIGNSAYTVAPLANPANDAKAMGETLRELGFDVDVYVDLELGGMVEAIRKFGNKLKESRGLGLFFYAGHGMQIDGVNYLIPVQNGIEAADEVRYKSINADMVLSKMESAGNNFNIVIMDACRNNPFPKKFRSAEQGLARMDAPTGSIIAYATAPGSTAADGTGSNGLYTSHLLSAMKIPGLSVEEVFKQVRIGVLEESEGRQTPWEASSLTGNFEFVPKSKQRTAQKSQIPSPPPLAIAPTSHLQVMSNIVGASVYVNGINKGIISNSRALYIQNLTEDEVEVRLEQAGYSPQTQKVVLKKGEWQQAYFEFVPENNLATVKTTPVSPALPDTPLSIKKEKEVIPITQGNEYSDRSERKNEISDLFNRKPPGIESTEILPLGRFGADNNASRSQNPDKNIPETDIFKQP